VAHPDSESVPVARASTTRQTELAAVLWYLVLVLSAVEVSHSRTLYGSGAGRRSPPVGGVPQDPGGPEHATLAQAAAERWLQPEPDVGFSVMLNGALTWIVPALRAADRCGLSPKTPHDSNSAGVRLLERVS
jgi:hypothetical protein